MKVGGMQFFKSEGFDTLGKILPRAFDIARETTGVYIALTAICMLVFILLGMTGFDALVLALSTCSTGGFSNYDTSFGPFIGPLEYAASFFMILASIPFIRMVQLIRGSAQPLWRDVQVRAYLRWTFYAIAAIVAYRLFWLEAKHPLDVIRETTFNVVSTFPAPALPRPTCSNGGISLCHPGGRGADRRLHRLDLLFGQGVPLSGADPGGQDTAAPHAIAAQDLSAAL